MSASKSTDEPVDVLIIGAGASGLAAATTLCASGRRVRILEARPRIGGRILSLTDPMVGLPIELGAEFIHGKSTETFEILDHAGIGSYAVEDTHHKASPNGPVVANRSWDEVEKLFARMTSEGPDRSFSEFLKAQTDLSREVRELAHGYVEGFHASDARLIGEHALSQAEQASSGDADHAARLFGKYDSLPLSLYRSLPPEQALLHLNTVVREIHWRPGRVDVLANLRDGASPRQFSAERVIITLPWGVMLASANEPCGVRFIPEIESLNAAKTVIRMGNAIRIILVFRDAFWEKLTDEPMSFLHGDASVPFPVWWTALPTRAPVWTGWAGGPKAEALSMLSEGKVLEKAMETIGKLLGCGRNEIARHLQNWHYHDWTNDPYSRGAYSYVGVNGLPAAKALVESVDSTVYFAGEATCDDETRGTVNGAITSGRRAAKEILEIDRTEHSVHHAHAAQL